MQEIPADGAALWALAFILGLRHGLDADHLAAIDGLTRADARRRPQRARLCGAMFSLGHGAVVLAFAWLSCTLPVRASAPDWVGDLGAWISIACLAAIGTANLAALAQADPGAAVAPVGLKAGLLRRLLGRAAQAPGLLPALGTGALFALSFDTLGLAALFGAAALRSGSSAHALALGALFVLGMLLSDGLNGWWIARLVTRTDRLAARASRTMTATVAALGLGVAALGAWRQASPAVDQRFAGHELVLGVAVTLMVALAYALACRRGRRRPAAP